MPIDNANRGINAEMLIRCAHCGKKTDKAASAVNRAQKRGAPIFCSKRCFGLSRRKHKTRAHLVEEKRIYDAAYRAKNRDVLKVKKAAYHKATYDPAKQRAYNKRRMPHHVEYCRRPEYRDWKREYDRQYRAKEYGPFADAYLLAIDLNREVKTRSSNYEIRQENGTFGKRQARARAESLPSHRNSHRSAQGERPA